ncbi:membrane protein [Streptomyces noursei ATCC 11455]|nr:membrane protein [Streptomyces noursei ATCC 11455]
MFRAITSRLATATALAVLFTGVAAGVGTAAYAAPATTSGPHAHAATFNGHHGTHHRHHRHTHRHGATTDLYHDSFDSGYCGDTYYPEAR